MRILRSLCLALVLQATRSQAETVKRETELPFICTDGTELGISKICNGKPDCPDSSDETSKLCLRVRCPKETFRCTYGACIPRSLRCNGDADCIDESDESFCDIARECGTDSFRCEEYDLCMSFSNLCNGIVECSNVDEREELCKDFICPNHSFKCGYGGCVPEETVCDGFKDCMDGTDEAAAVCNSTTETLTCSDDEFACENGKQCVSDSDKCDGKLDCRDGSDEDQEICGDEGCVDGSFRCASGGCISEEALCNSVPDCFDFSDEEEEMCGKRLPKMACRLPAAKPETLYTVRGCEKRVHCRPGDVVPELSSLQYRCAGGAVLQGPDIVFCQSGRWLPRLPTCITEKTDVKCPRIIAPGAKKRCVKAGKYPGKVPCNEDVPAGTVMTMECRDFYEKLVGTTHMTCLHDGTWKGIPLQCVPICGKRMTNATTMITRGWNVPVEEPFPWHAILFLREKDSWKFICGGTLISDKAILLAGHCVWKTKANMLKVTLGSNSSDFNSKDDHRQIRSVSEVIIQPAYRDSQGNFGSDMAILILNEEVELNPRVIPACIDWWNDLNINDRHGEIGIIPGMGVTENDTFSEHLRFVTAEVVTDEACRGKQPRAFLKFLSFTTFCAGWANSTSVCNGDSGGGFFLKRPNSDIWEIHGIVSLSPRRLGSSLCDPSYYAVFTKVAPYLDWIDKVAFTNHSAEINE